MTETKMSLEDLTKAQRQAGYTVSRKTARKMNRLVADIYEEMLRRVPERTGALKKDLRIKVGHMRWEIGPESVPYAMYVEHGTKAHVIRAKDAKALRFNGRNGPVFAKEVRHPGTRAQPYIKPAFDKYIPNTDKDVAKIGATYWLKEDQGDA